MNNDERLFHEATSFFGGLGKPRTSQEKEFLKAMKAIVSAPRLDSKIPKTILNIINSDEINAVALIDQDHYYIGIYFGLIDCIMNTITHLIPREDKIFTNSRDRHYMALLILSFVVEHEFAHISNGHVKYHNSLTSLNGLPEIDRSTVEGLTPLDFQTFEMDADSCAMTRTIMWAINIVGVLPLFIRKKSFGSLLIDYESAVRNSFFACSVLFRIFADLQGESNSIDKLTHPPARIRQIYTSGVVEVMFGLKGKPIEGLGKIMTHEQALKCIQAAFDDVELRFTEFILDTDTTLQFKVADKYFGENKHYSKIRQNWDYRLREKLQPFAYCPLPENPFL